MPHTNRPHPEERCTAARLEGRAAPTQHFRVSGSRHGKLAFRLLAVLLIAVALAGCGKKGSPQAPADEPSTFPRSYPNV